MRLLGFRACEFRGNDIVDFVIDLKVFLHSLVLKDIGSHKRKCVNRFKRLENPYVQ